MATIQFTYPLRFQGIEIAEVDASVEIEMGRYEDDWSYGRILFHEVGGGHHVVDVIGGERGNVMAYLNRCRSIQEDILEAVHEEHLGRASDHRVMARAG